jgi:ABC-2 type transport system permease protein
MIATAALSDSWSITRRLLRQLTRQPVNAAFYLVQPVMWLWLFGELFERVVDIPGFATASYASFLAPGVVVMTALYTTGWSGMFLIEDLKQGVMDRFLVSPIHRSALIAGSVLYHAILVGIQSVLIVGMGSKVGADYPGGAAGIVALVGCAVLLGAAFSAFSDALALLLRSQEAVIGVVNFLVLPLSFLSAAFMQLDLAPRWIREVARVNPVNWAVRAGREAVGSSADWGVVLLYIGCLLALALAAALLATRSFRAYQRSI